MQIINILFKLLKNSETSIPLLVSQVPCRPYTFTKMIHELN